MWTPTTRARHSRCGLRPGSDLTDAEWAILAPFLPPEACRGRKRAYPMHEVANSICYVLRGGLARKLMSDTFPPWRTVYRWFARLRDDGTWKTINHHLLMEDRGRVGQEASPPAAVIDSQSVKTTESGGIRGYDGGKKTKGRKRHAIVDTRGRALKLQAHAADVQDCDGTGPLLGYRARTGRLWRSPLPMLAIKGRGSPPPTRSGSRSSGSRRDRWASRSTQSAGCSSGSSPGSTETVALPRTTRPRSRRQRPSSTPLRRSCYSRDWDVEDPIRDRCDDWGRLCPGAWRMNIAKRRGIARARVAVARKLAVILHRMWAEVASSDGASRPRLRQHDMRDSSFRLTRAEPPSFPRDDGRGDFVECPEPDGRTASRSRDRLRRLALLIPSCGGHEDTQRANSDADKTAP